jgi:formiminotetrahydrofolate cyclodeaminase
MKYRKKSIDAYSKELSSKHAVPGVGSAAAVVASLGISLSLMVARIMLPKIADKKKPKWRDIIHDAEMIKRNVAKVIDADPKLYNTVIKAYSLAKTNKSRATRIHTGLVASYKSMRNLAVDICSALKLNAEIARGAKGAIANDLYVSDQFLRAAFAASLETAQINVNYLADDEEIALLSKELTKIKKGYSKIKK